MSETYQICTRCYQVEGFPHVGTRCGPYASHEWVEAVVSDCPFMTFTAGGRPSRKRVLEADQACLAAGEDVHGSHHYGDSRRRHFETPRDHERRLQSEDEAKEQRRSELLKELEALDA